MKFVVLLACLLTVPFVGGLLRASPRSIPWVAFIVGFLPFVIGAWRLYFAPVSWPGWPGWPKGAEVSLLDFVSLAVILSLSKRPSFSAFLPWLLYVGAVLIAVPLAGQKIPGLFYVWQLLRMIIVFMAAAQLARVPKASEQLLYGVIAGVLFQAYFAVTQYLQGTAQPGGAFGAQNLLGLMTNFALVPSIALLMVQKRPVWAFIGLAAALLLDFLTASRATLGLAGVGILATVLFSCAKGMTGRKAGLMVAILLVSAAIAPVAWQSMLSRRSGDNVESSNHEREAFKRAAWMIIRDYPYGVGPNNYVVVANVGGYSARAGVNWNSGSRATSVHNSYLLVWAETGLLGIVTMLILIWSNALRGIRAAFRYRQNPKSEILLAFALSLLVFGTHILFEWAWVLFVSQYMFAIYAGVTVGLIAELRADGRPVRNTQPRALPISVTT